MFITSRCTRILRRGSGWSGGRSASRTEVGGGTPLALKGYDRRAKGEVLEKAKEARAAPDQTIESGKHFIEEKAADVEAAVKAGRETMKEKMDTCCS